MANQKKRLVENAEGNFFVDSVCFISGLSRRYAPRIFGDTGTHAFVNTSRKRIKNCWPRCKLCWFVLRTPLERYKIELQAVNRNFSIELTEDVFLCGPNNRDSYGADSYFVRPDEGNWLIDSPRYTNHLAD